MEIEIVQSTSKVYIQVDNNQFVRATTDALS